MSSSTILEKIFTYKLSISLISKVRHLFVRHCVGGVRPVSEATAGGQELKHQCRASGHHLLYKYLNDLIYFINMHASRILYILVRP